MCIRDSTLYDHLSERSWWVSTWPRSALIVAGAMEDIDRTWAGQLLLTLYLKIGDWNERTVRSPSKATHRSFAAPTRALELYVAAHRRASWIISGSWTLLQIDNSTSPMDDEVAVFENLVLKGQHSWDIAAQHTFLLDGSARQLTLVLLIYFALLFTCLLYTSRCV